MTHSFEGTLTNTFRVVLGGTTFATLFTTLPWATACFLQSYLPASILSTRRFFVQGFLAGFPIMALPSNAVPEIMFMLSRMSADSWWKVAVKQKRVKSRRCVFISPFLVLEPCADAWLDAEAAKLSTLLSQLVCWLLCTNTTRVNTSRAS